MNFPTAAAAILAFWDMRVNGEDPSFTADQLRFYVQNNYNGKTSPSSADRILRILRQKGKLDYTVENRGRSIYKAQKLGTTTPAELGGGPAVDPEVLA
jgi:hypothetical protein